MHFSITLYKLIYVFSQWPRCWWTCWISAQMTSSSQTRKRTLKVRPKTASVCRPKTAIFCRPQNGTIFLMHFMIWDICPIFIEILYIRLLSTGFIMVNKLLLMLSYILLETFVWFCVLLYISILYFLCIQKGVSGLLVSMSNIYYSQGLQSNNSLI